MQISSPRTILLSDRAIPEDGLRRAFLSAVPLSLAPWMGLHGATSSTHILLLYRLECCSMQNPNYSETQSVAHHSPDPAARQAGGLLGLTAIAMVVMVIGRVAADADQPTLLASLNAIADSRFLYGVSGGARWVSGIALGAAAWLLMKTWIIRERLGSPLVPAIFVASGICTALSGACAVVLALAVPTDLDFPGPFWETTAMLRETAGKIGFAAAGLAIVVAARYQWRVGGILKPMAPISAMLGVGMQFIWIDAVTRLHQYTGALLLLWFLVIGSLLLTGRVEQRYMVMRTAISPGPDPAS